MRALALVTVLLFVVEARAEEELPERTAAIALFDEGKRLASDGRIAEACEKFEAAQREAPGPGIELNLAHCWEQMGRTASAWAAYRHVASTDPRRVAFATERAEALEPRLARLVVSSLGVEPGLVVRRGGVLMEDGVLGVAVPVDPGEIQLEAEAPGRLPWSATILVLPESTQTVTVPALEPEPPPPPPPELPPPPPRSAARKWAAAGTGGAGILALGAAAALVVVARAQYDDAVAHHCDDELECDRTGYEAIRSARRKGTIATIAASAGVAALASAAVIWFLPPSRGKAPARVVPLVSEGAVGLGLWGSY